MSIENLIKENTAAIIALTEAVKAANFARPEAVAKTDEVAAKTDEVTAKSAATVTQEKELTFEGVRSRLIDVANHPQLGREVARDILKDQGLGHVNEMKPEHFDAIDKAITAQFVQLNDGL